MSISQVGLARRSLIIGIRLWPPLMTLASSPYWVRSAIASGIVRGLEYSNAAGTILGPLSCFTPGSPVVNSLPDRLGGDITANHFICRDAAKSIRHVLLCEPIGVGHGFSHNHVGRDRGAGDGDGATHAFEFDVLNSILYNSEGDQDG